jgi:DNA-binding NtrC family response regulator
MSTAAKVLIVEDEQDLRNVYQIILERAGFIVATSANGQEALHTFDDFKPEIVLLDIFMPIMDGKQFLQTLDVSKYPATKVVVYSNTADHDLMDEMLKLGAVNVVNKSSLAPSDLIQLVHTTAAQS